MTERISWNTAVAVADGPKLQLGRGLEVDAYDKLTVSVPGKAVNSNQKVTVVVQPSDADKVTLFCITSSRYGDKLTYTVKDEGDSAGASDVVLDHPHVMVGLGMVGLLGVAPVKIDFLNRLGNGNDAEITILVGRTAT
jgi:hypothetical protein